MQTNFSANERKHQFALRIAPVWRFCRPILQLRPFNPVAAGSIPARSTSLFKGILRFHSFGHRNFDPSGSPPGRANFLCGMRLPAHVGILLALFAPPRRVNAKRRACLSASTVPPKPTTSSAVLRNVEVENYRPFGHNSSNFINRRVRHK